MRFFGVNNVFAWGFLVFFWILFLFNIKFNFFGFSTLYLSIGCIGILGGGGIVSHKKIDVKLLLIVCPLVLAALISMISFFINKPHADLFLVKGLVALVAVALCSFSFFSLFSDSKNDLLVSSALAALVINAVMIIAMFVSVQWQGVYLGVLDPVIYGAFGGKDAALNSMLVLRMIGLTGLATYAVGFTQVMGLFLLSVRYHLSKRQPDRLFCILSFLLLLSAMLSSRSSFLGIFLWIIFCLIFYGKRFLKIALILVLLISLALTFFIAGLDEAHALFFKRWVFEPVVNGVNAGSVSENVKMLHTPYLDAGFFGFSRWYGDLGSDYFRSVDVGFIRIVLSGGFGSLVFILIHFLLLGGMFFAWTQSRFFKVLYLFLMIFFCGIMLKGAIIFDFFGFDFILLLLLWVERNLNRPKAI